MRKKRTNWTEQKIAVLIQLYPIETTPRTAEVLGMCERAVKEKARSLGLKKAVKSRWMEHADYVRNHFAHRSYYAEAKTQGYLRAESHHPHQGCVQPGTGKTPFMAQVQRLHCRRGIRHPLLYG